MLMSEARLWTKNFTMDSVANFFIYLVYYTLTVIIAIYAMDTLQASPGVAGLASGIFILTALFSRIFTGKTIEQIGQKKMLLIGLVLYFATTFLYFEADNISFLLFIRSLHGIGFGIAATATGTIIAHIIPASRRGEGVGYYAMSVTLASAIGPFLGIYMSQHISFQIIFAICAIILAVSILSALLLKLNAEPLTTSVKVDHGNFAVNNFIEFKALPIAVIGGLLGFFYSSIISFLAPYTREIDLVSAGSSFFIVYSIIILFSRPITGRLFDKKGENFVMYPAFLVFAIGMILLSQAHNNFILLAAGGLLGLGFGTFMSSGQAIAITLSPPHRVGLATSTFFSLTDGGVGIGPLFLGLLVPSIGFRGLYMLMAGGAIFSMFLYYLLHGRKKRQQESVVIN